MAKSHEVDGGPSVKRVAIYTRISLDRNRDSLSPERQAHLCRQSAEAKGWTVVQVFEDRDASGWKRGTKRPSFDRMTQAIGRREVDVVMAHSLSRLGRRASKLLEFLEFLHENACELSVLDLGIDTTGAIGRMVFALTASFAELESEQISERVASAHQVAAQKGEMHSGGARGFGYNRDGTHVAEEAEVVREVATRLLGGESIRSVAFDLNERNVKTTQGKAWSGPTLRQMIGAPRLTGLRAHGDEMIEGSWEPILDRSTWTALQRKLDHGKPGRPRTVRVHLLSGIAVCGLCGGPLKTMGFRKRDNTKFERYQCVRQPGQMNCGGIAIAKDSLESYVLNQWINFMSEAQIRPVEEASWEEAKNRVEDLTSRLERLSVDYYVNGEISRTEFFAARDPMDRELSESQSLLATLAEEEAKKTLAVRPGNRDDLAEWWDKASPANRREAISQAVKKIVIAPAERRGGNKFDTRRIRISWEWDMYMKAEDARWDSLTDDEKQRELIEAAEDEAASTIAKAAAGWP